MKYVVFDLDQTLAELQYFYYFIRMIRLKEFTSIYIPILVPHISQVLEDQLEMAYHNFINLILQEELSNHPIGIIRPGVLPMMRYLARLKRKHQIGHVVIYSNNRILENLEAIRDIINIHVGCDLIESCIHWDHPIRLMDRQHPAYTKTWDTLKLILQNDGAPYDLHPDDVLFFDDQSHPFLQCTLQNHYLLVTPYQYQPSFDHIQLLFLQAINSARIPHNDIIRFLVDIISFDQPNHPYNLTDKSLSYILACMKVIAHQSTSHPELPPMDRDRGMKMMKIFIQMHLRRPHRYTQKLKRHSIKKKVTINRDKHADSMDTDCHSDHNTIHDNEKERRVFCTNM